MNHIKQQIIILMVILTLLLIYSAEASSTRGAFAFTGFGNGVGTRAMGMNGAYSAVADDSSALYWNPAGLSMTLYKELSFTYADLYDIDLITNSTLNMSYPETEKSKAAVALGWNRLQYDLESWTEEVFLASYARTIYQTKTENIKNSRFAISSGVTVKYLRQSSKLDITSLEMDNTFCKARGIGIDAGILARIKAVDGRNLICAGLTAQDIPTVVEWNSMLKEYLPIRYIIGVSSQPLPRLTVALDMEGEQNGGIGIFRLGIEHWFLPIDVELPVSEKNLAIRGGVANELDSSRLSFAGGIGIRWSSWQLDYAYIMDNNGLGDTRSRFTVSVRF